MSVKFLMQGREKSRGNAQSQKRIFKKLKTVSKTNRRKNSNATRVNARGGERETRMPVKSLGWNLAREREMLKRNNFTEKANQGISPFAVCFSFCIVSAPALHCSSQHYKFLGVSCRFYYNL